MHKKTRETLIRASNKNIYLWLELMMFAHERDLAYRRLRNILRGKGNERDSTHVVPELKVLETNKDGSCSKKRK